MSSLDEQEKTTLQDADFCRQLVEENIGWMLAVAMRILNDHMHAEDAVQNAFPKIFQGLDTFEGRSKLRTWMHRIVVNEALMIRRRQKSKNEAQIDPLLPKFDRSGCRIDQELVADITRKHYFRTLKSPSKFSRKFHNSQRNIVLSLLYVTLKGSVRHKLQRCLTSTSQM